MKSMLATNQQKKKILVYNYYVQNKDDIDYKPK